MGQSSSSLHSSNPDNDGSDDNLLELEREIQRQRTQRAAADNSTSDLDQDDNVGPSDSLREARSRFMRNLRESASSGSSHDQYSEISSVRSLEATLSTELEQIHPPRFDWMGRSIESLIFGYSSTVTRTLSSPHVDDDFENTNYLSTKSSLEFLSRQLPLDFGVQRKRGGSHAHYNDYREVQGHTVRRRRVSSNNKVSPFLQHSANKQSKLKNGRNGPNVVLSLLARETTGHCFSSSYPPSTRLLLIGGRTLFQRLDSPAGGMVTEIRALNDSIDNGDWTTTCRIVARLTPRLMGDPMRQPNTSSIEDPTLPRFASPHLAGGGRLGLERHAFVMGGGVHAYLRIFSEKAFVETDLRNDARRLNSSLVATKLASCWNEALVSLRDLVFALPHLVESGAILDGGRFLPFLFTLLSHDVCFDSSAVLIEEILSILSHTPPTPIPTDEAPIDCEFRSANNVIPVGSFFLGNVPNLYSLWRGFSCRQLAHFCRILALLVFEPEDRQLLESPSVLKSLDLLQLRRDRAARAGRDATVDMNQSILLGDTVLMERLLQLLRIMNYAPKMRRRSVFHVMAHFPFISETLIMLGLRETDNWDDIHGLDSLARGLLQNDSETSLSDLGALADMLENLAGSLQGDPSELLQPGTQLGQIIHVINAAQQTGVVGARRRRGREGGNLSTIHEASVPINASSLDNLSPGSVNLSAELNFNVTNRLSDGSNLLFSVEVVDRDSDRHGDSNRRSQSSSRIQSLSQQDAANELQFNALLLAPYQVEVLFVLCTLLGGRRKIDAQRYLKDHGLITILDEMFQRLSFGATARNSTSIRDIASSRAPSSHHSSTSGDQQSDVVTGIHGPGCECTPESALSVQYLRLLHNFCDRDCDNYLGRRLLLSKEEREYIFSEQVWEDIERPISLKPGLFSKLIRAFCQEADDSPHRFWLASCAETFLRGSSPHEQLFAAKSGILSHLIRDIVSDRLHCAGSLQTSFDLLGEICKGNSEVLHLLVSSLDEDSFRKLMSAAAANLVDSNVFLRSLILTIERISAARQKKTVILPNRDGRINIREHDSWKGDLGGTSRYYLTHSWWDASIVSLHGKPRQWNKQMATIEDLYDDARSSDWFPSGCNFVRRAALADRSATMNELLYIDNGVGYNGWQLAPSAVHNVADDDPLAWMLGDSVFLPNTIERLAWFLITNQSRLLRDLLCVVDLSNINHENICCLNTAVVVSVFASRRLQLTEVILELQRLNAEEKVVNSRCDEARAELVPHEVMMSASMNQLDIDGSSPKGGASFHRYRRLSSILGDRSDTLRNFRELLWFWSEYYTHRGRDRLSLEFSSHLRFQDWLNVVSILAKDDDSCTALVRRPLRMPKSPYQRAPRIVESPRRGA